MLYLGNIISSDTTDTYTATARTIEFFTQKYREDPAFAQRVDASVARILAVKLGLYETPTLSNVLVSDSRLDDIGSEVEVTFDVARNSATLISPDKQDLATALSLPPQANESMVFITDTLIAKQCTTCIEQPSLAMDALQQTVLKRGLTLEEAQKHCSSDESSSRTATKPKAKARTERHGPWFEGYDHDEE